MITPSLIAELEKVPAAVHVDLDGAAHIFRFHGWPYAGSDDPLFESGLRRALEFFDATGVRATLFVIAEDLDHPRKRELLQEAVARGHEIASHSVTHRRLTDLGRQDKRREIVESRERLQNVLGVEVRGFRAPGFAVDQEAVEFIDAAGYDYDSSFLARRNPPVPLPPQGGRLLELPIPMHGVLPLPFHPCYSLVMGKWLFRSGLRQFRRTGAALVLLFHLTDLADPLPADRLPGPMARFYTLSYLSAEHKQRRCREMLDWVRRDYELVDTGRLVAWESARRAAARTKSQS